MRCRILPVIFLISTGCLKQVSLPAQPKPEVEVCTIYDDCDCLSDRCAPEGSRSVQYVHDIGDVTYRLSMNAARKSYRLTGESETLVGTIDDATFERLNSLLESTPVIHVRPKKAECRWIQSPYYMILDGQKLNHRMNSCEAYYDLGSGKREILDIMKKMVHQLAPVQN